MDNDREPKCAPGIDLPGLKRAVYLRMSLAIVAFGLLFFLPAGTILYWKAWVYMSILFIPMTVVVSYLLRHDPELLERRLRIREKQTEQKKIVAVTFTIFLAAFLIPGFDKRFGWSSVPAAAALAADAFVVLGYSLFVRSLLENRYASRIIEVEEGQSVITTGPYAWIRHPMYLAITVIYLFSPLALGSYWGTIAAALVPIGMAARILNEEKLLLRELHGYQEYCLKTRYRLIPGIW
jgi:protein-S-isoprenylcysteine O-methyltransferase Ste14